MLRRVALMGLVAGVVVWALLGSGCGMALDWPGIWDETCYDCRTVCEGTEGTARDDCLAACYECQGYGSCFAMLEDQFAGMSLAMSDWEQVDCSEVQ